MHPGWDAWAILAADNYRKENKSDDERSDQTRRFHVANATPSRAESHEKTAEKTFETQRNRGHRGFWVAGNGLSSLAMIERARLLPLISTDDTDLRTSAISVICVNQKLKITRPVPPAPARRGAGRGLPDFGNPKTSAYSVPLCFKGFDVRGGKKLDCAGHVFVQNA